MPTEKTIKIHRGNEDDPNFVSPRSAPQDRSLTWEARGMLWYLLSKPGDWEVRPLDLQQQCGKNRAYKILNELIQHQYIQRIYHRDEKGRIEDIEYMVYSKPVIMPSAPFPQNQELENSDTTVIDNKSTDSVTGTSVNDSEILHTTAKAVSRDENSVSDDVKALIEPTRNWLFEAIGHGVYQMDRDALRDAPKQVRQRIGVIATGSKKRDDRGLMGCFFPDHKPTQDEEHAAAHKLLMFFADWRRTKPGIDPPSSSGLIWLRFCEWEKTNHKRPTAPIVPPGYKPPIPKLPPPIVTKKEPEYDF